MVNARGLQRGLPRLTRRDISDAEGEKAVARVACGCRTVYEKDRFVFLPCDKDRERFEAEERVIVRGVFADGNAAAQLAPLAGEVARNLVSVFEDVDMEHHVGFDLSER
jgi:hypothetical protein